jgi:hypothetical protein
MKGIYPYTIPMRMAVFVKRIRIGSPPSAWLTIDTGPSTPMRKRMA